MHIEPIDGGMLALLTGIIGKLGFDERRRRRNGGNGNEALGERMTRLEDSLDSVVKRIDRGFAEVKDDLAEARASRSGLYDQCRRNEVAIGKCETRLETIL